MKTTCSYVLMLFAFVVLVFVPNGFAQDAQPEYIVRVIYFHPKDRQPQSDIDTVLNGLIKKVQQFYADEMERHGFGSKTFRLETDENNQLIVHRVRGKFNNMHYYDAPSRIGEADREISEQFDKSKNIIYLIWVDLHDPIIYNSQIGGNAGGDSFRGTARIGATNFERAPGHLHTRAWTTIAHELGHAFGLQHDFRDDHYIMAYGASVLQDQLSFCAAEWLDAHRYFNKTQNVFDQLPTIEMLSPSFVSPPNTVRLRFEVTHFARLHQAQLLTNSFSWQGNPSFDPTTLLDCKSLNENSATIEFVTTELAPGSEYVNLHVIDENGNFTSRRFSIDITSLLPDSKPVLIPDANLAAAIRESLGLAPETTITQLDMLGLGRLNAPKKQVVDLTGLQHATNLQRVDLNENQIVDLTPVAGLTQLRSLLIIRNKISDVRPLSGLTQLSVFWIWDNQISDISPLTGLTNLTTLNIGSNQISDISPLTGLTNLRNLGLEFNQISDITPLVGLTKLGYLNLWNNQISDASPLVGFTDLEELNLVGNPIKNQKPLLALLRKNPNVKIFLKNLDEPLPVALSHFPEPPVGVTTVPAATGNVVMPDAKLAAAVRKALGLGSNAAITKQKIQGLTELDARDSQIKNLTGLEHATQLTYLFLYNNQISDVSPLRGLTQLRNLGLDGNQISNIRPLSGLKQLELLHIGGNQINNSGVRLLTNLTKLKWLALWGNQISNITPLAKLTKLEGLWIGGNKIRDVSPLAGLVNLETLHLDGNPIQDTSPLASLTKLRDVDIDISQVGAQAGPKIEGPWLWTIVPTGGSGGRAAAVSGRDWLATASGGAVTEQQIATRGAIAGAAVGNKAWTPGKLAPTGGDNITRMVNAIGLGIGDIDNHVAYGSIAFHSPRQQNTELYVGSDDAVKVWLNGVLVHNNPVDRGASDYQDAFPVTLKQGKNILLVAVYEQALSWSGFFGFEKAAVYSLVITPVVQVGASERPPMYWINVKSGTLHRLVGAEVENLVPSVRNATGLAMDVAGSKLYWTERTSDSTGRIRRANLDGTNVQLVKELKSVPHGIALDAAGRKLYWTASSGKIKRANLNGSGSENVVPGGLESPKGLALDVSGGKVYWTEMSGRIRRANLDGSNVEDVVAIDSGTPMNLVVFDDKVYWTQKTGENLGEIRFVAMDENSGVVIRNTFTQGFPVGVALDAVENKLYWTTSNGEIGRSTLGGGDFQPNFVTGLGAPGAFVLNVETPVDVETPVVAATDAVLSISPSSVISPAVGEQLRLNLNITAGEAVAGYQVTLRFDPTALRYVESSNGDYLPDGAFFLQPVVNRDRVELASSTLTGVSNGGGTLATVTFEVMVVKASTLTLSDMLLSDSKGNTFLPRVEAAEITEPPELTADINGDGVVNIQDLVLVASNFGKTGENAADVNTDGVVNIADLVLVAGNLGMGLGAPSLYPGSLEMFTAADVREWLSQAHRLNSSHVDYQRGLLVLEQLLTALAPKETLLLPNYPNPFNPETWIPYQLAMSSDVKITIYDARGIVVRRLELGYRQAGYYTNRSRSAYWDGRNALGEPVASGVYFYHLEAEGVSILRKMVTLK